MSNTSGERSYEKQLVLPGTYQYLAFMSTMEPKSLKSRANQNTRRKATGCSRTSAMRALYMVPCVRRRARSGIRLPVMRASIQRVAGQLAIGPLRADNQGTRLLTSLADGDWRSMAKHCKPWLAHCGPSLHVSRQLPVRSASERPEAGSREVLGSLLGRAGPSDISEVALKALRRPWGTSLSAAGGSVEAGLPVLSGFLEL